MSRPPSGTGFVPVFLHSDETWQKTEPGYHITRCLNVHGSLNQHGKDTDLTDQEVSSLFFYNPSVLFIDSTE